MRSSELLPLRIRHNKRIAATGCLPWVAHKCHTTRSTNEQPYLALGCPPCGRLLLPQTLRKSGDTISKCVVGPAGSHCSPIEMPCAPKPLGLNNISSEGAFVTCNWQGDATLNGRGAWQVFVLVSNTSTGGRTITCTLVNGTQTGATSSATYTPKAVALAPGTNTFLAWTPSELPGAPAEITQPSVTCLLPAGTTLHYTGRNYHEDVGADGSTTPRPQLYGGRHDEPKAACALLFYAGRANVLAAEPNRNEQQGARQCKVRWQLQPTLLAQPGARE